MQVRDQWVAFIDKELDGNKNIFSWDIFRDWETTRKPEEKAERCLDYALKLRYGQDTSDLAVKFLERCLIVVERLFKENRFHGLIAESGEPSRARATAIRAHTFANALLGRGLDNAALREAAPDFVTWALHERWDDQSENAYLQAVRLLLAAGDMDESSRLLKIRRNFKWHGEQAEVLRRIVAYGKCPIDDKELLASFDAVFDPLRPPNPPTKKSDGFTEKSKTRLELGAIRDKFFVSPDGTIDWNRAIDGISR